MTTLPLIKQIRTRQHQTGQLTASPVVLDALLDRLTHLEAIVLDDETDIAPMFTFSSRQRIAFAPANDQTAVVFGRRGTLRMVIGSLDIAKTRNGDEWGGG